jgi:hypothetical protein
MGGDREAMTWLNSARVQPGLDFGEYQSPSAHRQFWDSLFWRYCCHAIELMVAWSRDRDHNNWMYIFNIAREKSVRAVSIEAMPWQVFYEYLCRWLCRRSQSILSCVTICLACTSRVNQLFMFRLASTLSLRMTSRLEPAVYWRAKGNV